MEWRTASIWRETSWARARAIRLVVEQPVERHRGAGEDHQRNHGLEQREAPRADDGAQIPTPCSGTAQRCGALRPNAREHATATGTGSG